MRTKLALLLALCRGADLLILDEPTSGLDPAVTEEVLQALVSHVADAEMTVFFSSHQIAEVEQIADRVAIIDRGRARGRPARSTICARATAAFSWSSTATRRTRHSARPASCACGARAACSRCSRAPGPTQILDEARALNPLSVDVVPVTLKEIFLETVAAED